MNKRYFTILFFSLFFFTFFVTQRVSIFATIFSSTRPTLSFISGPSGPTNDNTPSFTINLSNSSGSYSLSYQINGTAPTDCLKPLAVVAGAVTSFNLPAQEDASYTLYVCVYDSTYAYGSNVVARSYSVDTLNPVLTEVTPVDAATHDGTPSYAFNYSDTNTGTLSFASGCSSVTTSAALGNNTLTLSSLSNGIYDCTLQATDAAGNVSNLLSVTRFVVDTTDFGPGGINDDFWYEAVYPLPGEYISTNSPSLSGKQYTGTPPNPIELIYEIDGSLPATCNSPYSGDDVFDSSPYNGSGPSVPVTATGPLVGAPYSQGAHTLAICDQETGGGVGAQVIYYTFYVDTVLPAMTQSFPIGTTNDNTPNYSVSVAADTSPYINLTFGGGCTSTQTTFDTGVAGSITFSQLADATYAACTINYTDLAGNVGAVLNVTSFTVDDLPSLSTLSPIDGAVGVSASSNLAITFDQVMTVVGGTLTIKNSGGSTFESYALPSGNVTGTGTATLTINPTGSFVSGATYYVEISAGALQDLQANAYAGFSGAGTWDLTLADTTSPVISVVTPIPTPDNDSTPGFVFTSDESGVIGLSGGAHCASASSVFKTTGSDTLSLDTLVTGSYSACSVTVTDGAGNVSNSISTGAFDVDLTSPSISSMTYPNPTNDTTPTFTFNVNDAGGAYISGIETGGTLTFTINSVTYDESSPELTLVTGSNGSQNTAWSFTPPALVQGVYPFTVVANDLAGNSATTYIGSLTIDTTAPTVLTNAGSVKITSNSPSSGYANVGSVVTVQFEGSEHLTNLAGTIQGNTASFANPSGNIWQASYTFLGGETEGIVHFSITFDDSSGNSGSSSAVTTGGNVIYDESVPTIENLGFVTPTNDTTPTITFDIVDHPSVEWSGVDTSTVSITYNAVTYFLGANLTITAGVSGDETVSFQFIQPSVLTDATYSFDIDADDLSGNSATNYADTQEIDTVAPDVTLTYTANPTPSGTQTVTATFTEAMTVAAPITIDIDQPGSTDVSAATMSGGPTVWTYNYTVVAANGGTYIDGPASVNVTGTDPAGNAIGSITNPTFDIDTTAPDVTLTYTANPTPAGTQTVTATFTEPMIPSPTIDIDQPGSTDVSAATMSGGPTIWTYNYNVVTANGGSYIDGLATVTINATDLATNSLDATTNPTFVIDTTAPIVTLTYTANPKSAGVQTVTATFNEAMTASPTIDINQPGSTDISGAVMLLSVANWTYDYTVVTANGGTYIDGTATIDINGTDLAGNPVGTITNDTFVIDTTQPDVTLTYTTSPTNAGLMVVTATFTEPMMNTPTVAINQPGSTDISATSMGGGSTIWTYNYTVNTANGGTYIDGVATVTIAGYDLAGNTLDATTNPTFVIDTANPIVALTYSIDPAPAGLMTVTATFNESIVTTPLIDIDQPGSTDISGAIMVGGPTVWTYAYTVIAWNGTTYIDGTASVDVTSAEDSAGNENNAPTNDSFDIDTTDPVITIDPYDDPNNDSTPTITFSVDDNGAAGVDIASILFTIDSLPYDESDSELTLLTGIQGSQNTTWSFTPPILDPDGTFGFQIDAEDTVGNASMESNTIKIDTQIPVITLDSYTDPTQDETPSFSFSFEDEVAGSGVDTDTIVFVFNSISYDNADPELVITGSNGDAVVTGVFTAPLTPNGVFNLNIAADDMAGNSAGQVTGSIEIDNIAPVLTEVTPVMHKTNDTTPSYVFNTTEDGFIAYSGGCTDSLMVAALTGDNTLTFDELGDDRYYCDIQVTDIAGNIGTLSIRSFEVDTEAPEIGPIVLVNPYGNPVVSWFLDFTEEPHDVHIEIVTNDNDDEDEIIDLSPGDAGVRVDGDRLYFTPLESYLPAKYEFTIRGQDEAGNEADPETYTYIIEPEGPRFSDVVFDSDTRTVTFNINDNGKGINLASLSIGFSQGLLSNILHGFSTGSTPPIVCLPQSADYNCSLNLVSLDSDSYLAILNVTDNEAIAATTSFIGINLLDDEVIGPTPEAPQITGYSFSADQKLASFEILKKTSPVDLSSLAFDFAYNDFDTILQTFRVGSVIPINCSELTNGYRCEFSTRLLVPDNYLVRIGVSDVNGLSAFPFITGFSLPPDLVMQPDEEVPVIENPEITDPLIPDSQTPVDVPDIIRPEEVISQIEDVVNDVVTLTKPLGPLIYNFVYNKDFQVLSFTVAERIIPAEIRSLELIFTEKVLGSSTIFDINSEPPVQCFQTSAQYDCLFRTNTLKPGEYRLVIKVLDQAGIRNDDFIFGLEVPERTIVSVPVDNSTSELTPTDQTEDNTDVILGPGQIPLESPSALARLNSNLYEALKFITDATEYSVLMAYLDPYRQEEEVSTELLKLQSVDPEASMETVVPAVSIPAEEKEVFQPLLDFAKEAIDTVDRAITDYVFKSFIPRDESNSTDPVNRELESDQNMLRHALPAWREF